MTAVAAAAAAFIVAAALSSQEDDADQSAEDQARDVTGGLQERNLDGARPVLHPVW